MLSACAFQEPVSDALQSGEQSGSIKAAHEDIPCKPYPDCGPWCLATRERDAHLDAQENNHGSHSCSRGIVCQLFSLCHNVKLAQRPKLLTVQGSPTSLSAGSQQHVALHAQVCALAAPVAGVRRNHGCPLRGCQHLWGGEAYAQQGMSGGCSLHASETRACRQHALNSGGAGPWCAVRVALPGCQKGVNRLSLGLAVLARRCSRTLRDCVLCRVWKPCVFATEFSLAGKPGEM